MGEEMADSVLRTTCDFHGKCTDLLHAAKLRYGDRRLYFPSEGRHAEDFCRPKNPTASAGFEPANSGTRGQHANR
jgi:hypothetical protein